MLSFEDIRLVDGRLYPMRWKMVSVTKPGHETVLAYDKLKFDRPIAASVFTEENMRQPF